MGRRGVCGSEDDGSAVTEFIVIVALLLIPLAYALMSVMQVQAASAATTHAVREAGRAFVTADSEAQGREDARAAAGIAFADQGFDLPRDAMRIDCEPRPCLTPGGAVTVTVDWSVPLPWVPTAIGERVSLPITARHEVPVDAYRFTP